MINAKVKILHSSTPDVLECKINEFILYICIL